MYLFELAARLAQIPDKDRKRVTQERDRQALAIGARTQSAGIDPSGVRETDRLAIEGSTRIQGKRPQVRLSHAALVQPKQDAVISEPLEDVGAAAH